MAAGKQTQKQLDTLIAAADAKIDKYKGYIAKLNEEKKGLNAKKRALAAEAEKKAKAVATRGSVAKKAVTSKATAAKKVAAGTAKAAGAKATVVKKTVSKASAAKKAPAKKAPAKKAEPSLLEGVLEELKKGGLDPAELLGGLLGGNK